MRTTLVSIITILVIVSLLMIATGCAVTTPQPAPAVEEEAPVTEEAMQETSEEAKPTEEMAEVGEPYKIGALLSITGGASALGAPERNTLEMLQQQLNTAGGIKGPDGLMHQVELFIYDTESDETKAVLVAKKLIEQDQVSVIIGPTTSGESLAILDTVQKAEVPMVSLATSIKIVEPVAERKWAFKVTWKDDVLCRKWSEYLAGQGITKVGWLIANNAFGDSGLTECGKVAPDYGIEIVASEKYEQGDTDMTAQLTKIRGAGAEALVIWGTLPELAIASKNAFDLGMDIPKAAVGGSNHPNYVELAGPAAVEGTLSPTGKFQLVSQLPDSDPQKEVILNYIAQYESEFDEKANNFGGHASDALHIIVGAMEKAGPDRAAIRDALEEVQDFVGVNGIFTINSADHCGMTVESIVMNQLVNGEWQLVQP